MPNIRQSHAPRPQNVERWLNVIDTSDYLSYAIEPIFKGVTDVTFDSGRGPLAAPAIREEAPGGCPTVS